MENHWGLASPAPHLIDTNGCPTSEEICAIRSILAVKKPRLAWLDGEHERLTKELRHAHPYIGEGPGITFFNPCADARVKKAILSDVYLERHATRQFINQHESALSPLKRFPPELLSTLFVWCLPDESFPWFDPENYFETYDFPEEPEGRLAKELCPYMIPMLLSGICRYWREVAHSTPALWSEFVLDRQVPILKAGMVREWIVKRTGQHPLSLKWNQPFWLDELDVYMLFRDFIRRWGFLEILLHVRGNLTDIRLKDEEVPIALQDLEVSVPIQDLQWIFDHLISRAPNLRRLNVSCCDDMYYTILEDFRSDRLTTLVLQPEIPVTVILTLLNHLPRLTTAELEVGPLHPGAGIPALPDILHKSLSNLTLIATPPSYIYLSLIYHVTFPQLKKLTLQCPFYYLHTLALHHFLTRCSCKLESLILRSSKNVRESSICITPFLSHPAIASSLKSLEISVDDRSETYAPLLEDELLDFLTLRPHHISLPRMTELHIESWNEKGVSLYQLSQMLASRFMNPPRAAKGRPIQRLRYAKIEMKNVPLEERPEMAHLRALKNDGHPLRCRIRLRSNTADHWQGEEFLI